MIQNKSLIDCTIAICPLNKDLLMSISSYHRLLITDGALRFNTFMIKSPLFVFLLDHALDGQGQSLNLSSLEASEIYHHLICLTYFLPFAVVMLTNNIFRPYQILKYALGIQTLLYFMLAFFSDTYIKSTLMLSLPILIIANAVKPSMSTLIGNQSHSDNSLLKRFMFESVFLEFGIMSAELISPLVIHHLGFKTTQIIAALASLCSSVLFFSGHRHYQCDRSTVNPTWQNIKDGLLFFLRALSSWRKQFVLLALFLFQYVQVASLWVGFAHELVKSHPHSSFIMPGHLNFFLTFGNTLCLWLLLRCQWTSYLSHVQKISYSFALSAVSYLGLLGLLHMHNHGLLINIGSICPFLLIESLAFSLIVPLFLENAYCDSPDQYRPLSTYRFYFTFAIGHALASLPYQTLFNASLVECLGKPNYVALIGLLNLSIYLTFYGLNKANVNILDIWQKHRSLSW